MAYLKFKRYSRLKGVIIYNILNNDGHDLGFIKRARVGKFMHWKWFPPCVARGELSMTNGCIKELSIFITSLYSKHKK